MKVISQTVAKTEKKFVNDLNKGDYIQLGGWRCIIKKVETVFHNTPKSRVRLVVKIPGAIPKASEGILLLPHGMTIEVLKEITYE